MKKALLIGASLVVSLGTAAQTLNVVVGEVTYKIPASQAGSMDYADGSRLTILGKTFQLKEVTRMYVDHSDVTDNSVNVTYNGECRRRHRGRQLHEPPRRDDQWIRC